MAEIVLGVAASHSPQLSTPAELWRLHQERDRQNRDLRFRGQVYDYEGLLQARQGEHLDAQIDDAVWAEKHARCDRAIDALAETLAETAPDLVVIIGDRIKLRMANLHDTSAFATLPQPEPQADGGSRGLDQL